VTGVYHFKNHIIPGFEFADHRIELILVGGWLPVDVRDDQSCLQSLQVSE